MKKLVMMLVTMMLTVNLFAGTAIAKIKKPNGETQRIVLDTNQKIATFITFMYEQGFKCKYKPHYEGVGTFADASKDKPYCCVFFPNSPETTMFMWKSDFDEVINEMKEGKYND